MADGIKVKIIDSVVVQENGIIRNQYGRIIARLCCTFEAVDFNPAGGEGDGETKGGAGK
jgi:hypothetical protein